MASEMGKWHNGKYKPGQTTKMIKPMLLFLPRLKDSQNDLSGFWNK
jgi:hypothetical protein